MDTSGGTELNAVRTVEHIDRAWCDPTAVALNAYGDMRPRYEAAGVPVICLAQAGERVGLAQRVRSLTNLFRKERFDVIHSHDMYTSALCSAAGRLARTPRVVSSKRWIEVPDRRWRLLARAGYGISDVVVANSQAVRCTLIEQDRVRKSKVCVIPNFVEDAAFEVLPPAAVARWRRDVGLPTEGTIVGSVAQLRVEKGHLELIEAVAGLRASGEAVTLALAGEGVFRDTILETARRLGIERHVVLLGRLPRLPSAHHLFDIGVLASHHEGMPNALIEAMAIGRPVVATSVGGIPELVTDRVTGLLVPARNAASLQASLAELLHDTALRARLGAAAVAFVRHNHSVSAAMSRLRLVHERGTWD